MVLQKFYFKAFFSTPPCTSLCNPQQDIGIPSKLQLLFISQCCWIAYSHDLYSLIKTFDDRECKAKPTFSMISKYMRMVELLLQFLEYKKLETSFSDRWTANKIKLYKYRDNRWKYVLVVTASTIWSIWEKLAIIFDWNPTLLVITSTQINICRCLI